MKPYTDIRAEAEQIVRNAIEENMPQEAVRQALQAFHRPEGNVVLVAIGKAAWTMADAAKKELGNVINTGIVITKYGHIQGDIEGIRCFEAGHPVPDENGWKATVEVEKLVAELGEQDCVLFLVSGGGSSLFEDSLVPLSKMEDVTNTLLACGADITEMNTIRKHLSKVKGGRFAQLCSPASVFSIVLSDVVGDSLDVISSGPAVADRSTCEDVEKILAKYNLSFDAEIMHALRTETPKEIHNVTTKITGSVRQLCRSAARECTRYGYTPVVLTSSLTIEAREAGGFLAAIVREYHEKEGSTAVICGGETVVHVTGTGKGGRNQELALGGAEGIAGLSAVCIIAVGSDGTDGPTDAAGGYVDGSTMERLQAEGIQLHSVLDNNDAYHALKSIDGLVMTGPTGTNVNDLYIALIRK